MVYDLDHCWIYRDQTREQINMIFISRNVVLNYTFRKMRKIAIALFLQPRQPPVKITMNSVPSGMVFKARGCGYELCYSTKIYQVMTSKK